MARQSKKHRNRNRHSSSSTLSSLSPDSHEELQTPHDGSGGASSNVINNSNPPPPPRSGTAATVPLHPPSDATPAQGYRFSTLRVASLPTVTGAEGIEGDTVPMTQMGGDADESKSERDKRERNERAARRRSRRSDAPSPTDEGYYTPLAPVVVRRPVGGGGSNAAAAGAAMTIRTKRRRGAVDVYDNDSSNGETKPDVDNDDELDDQDVVAGEETPAPKRARRGAGKAETMSATTATGRALAGATGPFVARASSPSDGGSSEATVSAAVSDCEEAGALKDDRRRSIAVDVVATDQQEEEGQVITSASASAAQFDYTAASYRPPLLGDNYFRELLALNESLVNDSVRNSNGSRLPPSATTLSTRRFEHIQPQPDDYNNNELPRVNTAAAANGNSAPRRLPPLGTISTRPYAAFDDLPPQPQSRSSSTVSSSSSSPPPPSEPNNNNNNNNNVQSLTQPDLSAILDALSALTTPFPALSRNNPPHNTSMPPPPAPAPAASQLPSSSDRLASTKKQRNNNVKDLEILYEGRGTRRVSEGAGAQGRLEFGKPPTPRKSKARTRIATSMPAELMSKVATSMQGGDGKKSGGGGGGEVDK